MIEISHFTRAGDTMLVVDLRGRLTREQYESFRSQMESEIRHYPNLRLLFEIGADLKWDPRSDWRHLRFDSNHRTSIYKLAIVGGEHPWQKWLWAACLPMNIKEAAFFASSQRHLALVWLETTLEMDASGPVFRERSGDEK